MIVFWMLGGAVGAVELCVWRYQRVRRGWDAAERRDVPAERAYFGAMRES